MGISYPHNVVQGPPNEKKKKKISKPNGYIWFNYFGIFFLKVYLILPKIKAKKLQNCIE